MKYELTIEEAARFLGLDEQDMWEWYHLGGGPHFLKTARGPVYRGQELKNFRDKVLVDELARVAMEKAAL